MTVSRWSLAQRCYNGLTLSSPGSYLNIAAVSSPAMSLSIDAVMEEESSLPPQKSAPAGTASCDESRTKYAHEAPEERVYE